MQLYAKDISSCPAYKKNEQFLLVVRGTPQKNDTKICYFEEREERGRDWHGEGGCFSDTHTHTTNEHKNHNKQLIKKRLRRSAVVTDRTR